MIADYLNRVSDSLQKTDNDILKKTAWKIIETKETGARIYTAGNGGSYATATHFCNDLIKGCRVDGRTGFSAQCLCDSLAVVTCLANDFSYEDVFAVELQTIAQKGDILILFSGSGNSPNIINAAKFARERGIFVIGFTGRDGGQLKELCDLCCVAPTWSMEELEDLHLCYCHCLVNYIRSELADIWDIEIIRRPALNGTFHSALFDFDGTVSLLREGWQEVMVPYFTEVLSEAVQNPDMSEIKETVTEFVDILTGKQTIFQCIRLDEEVQKRGGKAVDPYVYKAEYLRRLMERINNRLESLRNGTAKPEDYLVPGCADFLKILSENGIRLYLASGTDETDVLNEAKLLQVDSYFDGGIYGAKDSIKSCSKEIVIRRILEENKLAGSDLISFGDGYVEIQLVKEIGGYSIAVATDEVRKKGINAKKRSRLLSADADAVIPDFANYEKLIRFIKGVE